MHIGLYLEYQNFLHTEKEMFLDAQTHKSLRSSLWIIYALVTPIHSDLHSSRFRPSEFNQREKYIKTEQKQEIYSE